MDPQHPLNGHPLKAFLMARYSHVKEDPSFTAMGTEIRGKWSVSETDYPKFYDLLHDYLFIKKGRTLNIVEQPRLNESKPLMIDIDFHYSIETNLQRTFDKSHILNFTKNIGQTLKQFFEIDGYNNLRFFITLRPSRYEERGKQYYKDGIHILCPDITLVNEKQKMLRNYILQEKYLSQCFENTGYTNKDEDVYDVVMTRKHGWFPYGESKPNIPPYELAHVYNYIVQNDSWVEEDIKPYTNRKLLELLSIRYNINPDENLIKPHMQEAYNKLVGPKVVVQEEVAETNNSVEDPRQSILQEFVMSTPSEQEKQLISRVVLECLAKERAEENDSWMRVGWALHSMEKSEEMFDLWMKFSAYSPKSKHNNIHELKRNFFTTMSNYTGPRLTERSLHNWAKKDNPQLYKEIVDDYILEYIRQHVDGTHFHIAQLLRKLYKNNYVASINNRSTDWYYYDDTQNMWTELNQGIQLKQKISNDLAHYISEARNLIRKDLAKADKVDEQERIQAELKRFLKIEMNLYNNGFVESTMRMAEAVFCDQDFTNKLNKNPLLFACKNGVLELRVKAPNDTKEHVYFRPGIPEDYLSFLAGYNFPDHEPIEYTPYDPANPVYKEIYEFFNKIFPDIDLRNYFLRLLASCLEGANREQCYYTWEGVGGNGKSKIVELMRLTFGDYQTSLQATTLTRKRPESGAANPDIIAIKNKRFIYLQEPDEKEPLNTSRMKQFSGEDMIEARGLFKDQEKFKVTGKLNMMCNSKPIIRTMDRGTWRRIRVIPFVSKFVGADEPEYIAKKKNVFLRDNDLDRKLIEWRTPFLSLLVHIYETQYLVNGLEPTPEIVKKASEDYKESSDSYAKFAGERIRKNITTENDKTTFKEFQRAYSKWVEASGGSARRLSGQDLLNRINEEFGEPLEGKYYMGVRVFMYDEDVELFDQPNL